MKNYPPLYVKYGKLEVEWDVSGNVRVIRQDNAQHLELSLTEWIVLLKVVELRGWPVVPPQSIADVP